MTRGRWAGVAIVAGFALAAIATRVSPSAVPPLYDGVPVVEPYVWLDPPPDHPGNPTGNHATVAVKGGSSPLIALDTLELTPQAQILIPPTALHLPAGTTSLDVSITPVEPVAPPPDGHIDGNTYRISILTQAGAPVTATPGLATVVMRATAPPPGPVTMELYANGAWSVLPTDSEGPADQFRSVVTGFGDFALVLPGPAGSGAAPTPASTDLTAPAPATASPAVGPPAPTTGTPLPAVTLYAGIAIGLVLLGLLATALFPRRRGRNPNRGWSDRPPPRTRR